MVVCGLNWGAELVGEATVVRRQIQICLPSQIRLAGIVRAALTRRREQRLRGAFLGASVSDKTYDTCI